jgi:hypothetical protein
VRGAEVGDTTTLAGVFDLADCVAPPGWAGPNPPARAVGDVDAGVVWDVTGGGWTAVVMLGWAPVPAVSAAIDGSNSGMRSPANEVLGAGPIAAPMATPSASIPAVRTAVARGEGRRGGLGVGGVGVSGVVVNCLGWVEVGRFLHKLAYLDRANEDYGRFIQGTLSII